MNNWRLLLLAVIAALQPIGSFTEPNFIDGHQECCDHRSNSIAKETRLYGEHRKSPPEERRLSTRGDIREERRYEARNDPVTRSSERLTLERAERRISFEPTVRFSTETRFARDQERRNRISVDARESRQAREHQDRRTRESVSGDSWSQYERDVLDSRRNRISRDSTRIERIGNERLFRESANSRDARRLQNSEDLHRVSANRETMAVLSRERDDVTRDVVRRDSRVKAFRSVTRVQLDNNERRTLDNADNRRSRSLDSRVNSIIEREDLKSRTDMREDRRSRFRVVSERVDERRQRNNGESRVKTSAIRRDSSERMSADRKRESRDTVDRVDRTGKNIERINERREQRDESQLSRERMILRESNHLSSAERRQALARESRILNANARSDRIVRSNDRTDERIELFREAKSRDSTTERRQDSRISRMLETISRNERLVKDDERRNERRQPSTRSLERVSEQRRSRDSRSMDRENNFRDSTRFSERKVRDEILPRYRRDVRSVERSDERSQQRDESIISRDRTIPMLHESRASAERRQESRTSESSRLEVRARSERESRIREDLRDNVRSDVSRREREDRRASREQTLHRMARDNERKHDREMSKTSRFAERASSNKRDARLREDARSDRVDVHRHVHRASRDKIVVLQRLTRDVSGTARKHDARRTRNDGTYARIQRTRTLEGVRNERRDVREGEENRASRDRVSVTRESRENIEDYRRELRGISKNSRVDIRNEVTRNRGDVRMEDRLEVRRQQDESPPQHRASLQRQTRDTLAARSVKRRSQKVASRDAEINIRSERLSRSRDERRVNGLEVRNNRDFRTLESRRESRRMTERKVQPNRHNLAMERIERTPNRAIRDVRVEAKLRSSDIVLAKDDRTDTRQAVDSRFRNLESKVHEIESADETSDNQNALNWQMIFYSLQGAYLCGLLMQMLTEKSPKGKSRNFSWWSSSSKDLVKVD